MNVPRRRVRRCNGQNSMYDMAKFEKGHKKIPGSGRKAGTPNKTTELGKKNLKSLLEDYRESGLMESDFATLEPRDRLMIAERLMAYVMPKLQSVSASVSVDENKRRLETRLGELASEESE